jgi:dTDP-4-dehydrorhamnose 3,5-epimerase
VRRCALAISYVAPIDATGLVLCKSLLKFSLVNPDTPVAVNLRQSSPTFGKWVGEILSANNKKQMWIPEGFAHGFLTLSDTAEFLYKTTDFYSKDHEQAIMWNDETIGIDWLMKDEVLSSKDKSAVSFKEARYFS